MPRRQSKWAVERSARKRWASWAGSKELWWLCWWSQASGRATTRAEVGVSKQAGSVREG